MAIKPTWKVERWGGHAHHKRRVVYAGIEQSARCWFRDIAATLRRGSVELIKPDGTVAAHHPPVTREGG